MHYLNLQTVISVQKTVFLIFRKRAWPNYQKNSWLFFLLYLLNMSRWQILPGTGFLEFKIWTAMTPPHSPFCKALATSLTLQKYRASCFVYSARRFGGELLETSLAFGSSADARFLMTPQLLGCRQTVRHKKLVTSVALGSCVGLQVGCQFLRTPEQLLTFRAFQVGLLVLPQFFLTAESFFA